MGLSLANVFSCHYEIKWFNDCPEKFKPVFCKSYGDGFFILLKRPKHAKPFVDYMDSKHKNINFSFETKEKNEQIPFLDVTVFSENGKFLIKKRKETFTGVYTNMSSFIPLQRKFGLVYTSLYHSLCLVSDMLKFHFEIEKLKEILLSNDYFDKFIDMCISKCMNKLNIKKLVMLTDPKKARNLRKLVKSGMLNLNVIVSISSPHGL